MYIIKPGLIEAAPVKYVKAISNNSDLIKNIYIVHFPI
jgi:hypothetical protein